jgi:hypothetical protein
MRILKNSIQIYNFIIILNFLLFIQKFFNATLINLALQNILFI